MNNRAMVISRRAVMGSALAMALASCSDSGSTTSGGDGGLPKVSVGAIPVAEVSPLYLGIQKGFFRKRGLNVVAQQFQGGAAVVSGVIAGQVQLGFSNIVSLLTARDRGVPLIAVVGAGTSTGDPLKDINAVMVGPDSRLESAKDLVGKRVAINSWNSIGDTTIKTAVRKLGGDDWKIQFVRIPHPQMPAQLAAGTVDAIWEAEPFRTQVLQSGGRILFDNLTETYPKVQIAQFFTTMQTQRDNPQLVASFVEGIKESQAYAEAHLDEMRAVIRSYVKITQATAAMIELPVWSPQLDVQSALALGQAAHVYGTLTDAPDVAGLFGTA
jgi:NitT/TauT family transport system substrate-binding protein